MISPGKQKKDNFVIKNLKVIRKLILKINLTGGRGYNTGNSGYYNTGTYRYYDTSHY